MSSTARVGKQPDKLMLFTTVLLCGAGLVMVTSPPDELDRYFRGEEERWRKVIQEAGIKVD